jgi:glycosyltransferase involved in cell wall biosynthesis
MTRWWAGVDVRTFHPARYAPDALPEPAHTMPGFDVLHVGELARDQGVDLLAEALLVARGRDQRLRLVLAGQGPGELLLRTRLGDHAVFAGDLDEAHLAAAYASADLLVVPSASDVFGDAVLHAQASGLPVLAVDAGAPAELIENGRTGCLVAPEPASLAAAIAGLSRRATLLERLATGGLRATSDRGWEASLEQLADGYALAVAAAHSPAVTEVARAA